MAGHTSGRATADGHAASSTSAVWLSAPSDMSQKCSREEWFSGDDSARAAELDALQDHKKQRVGPSHPVVTAAQQLPGWRGPQSGNENWRCASCSNVNFASRDACNRCGLNRSQLSAACSALDADLDVFRKGPKPALSLLEARWDEMLTGGQVDVTVLSTLLCDATSDAVAKVARATVDAVGAGRLNAEKAARFCRNVASRCSDNRFSDSLQSNCAEALVALVTATSVSEAEQERYFQLCKLVGCLARSNGLPLSDSVPSTTQIMRDLQKLSRRSQGTPVMLRAGRLPLSELAHDLVCVMQTAWRDHDEVLLRAERAMPKLLARSPWQPKVSDLLGSIYELVEGSREAIHFEGGFTAWRAGAADAAVAAAAGTAAERQISLNAGTSQPAQERSPTSAATLPQAASSTWNTSPQTLSSVCRSTERTSSSRRSSMDEDRRYAKVRLSGGPLPPEPRVPIASQASHPHHSPFTPPPLQRLTNMRVCFAHRRKTRYRSTQLRLSGLIPSKASGLRARRRAVTIFTSTRAACTNSDFLARETRSTMTLAIAKGGRWQSM